MDKPNQITVLKHRALTAVLGMLVVVIWLLTILTQPQPDVHAKLVAVMVVIILALVAHEVYVYKTHKTYYTTRLKEKKIAQKAAHESKAELLAYAEEMKKRAHGQN